MNKTSIVAKGLARRLLAGVPLKLVLPLSCFSVSAVPLRTKQEASGNPYTLPRQLKPARCFRTTVMLRWLLGFWLWTLPLPIWAAPPGLPEALEAVNNLVSSLPETLPDVAHSVRQSCCDPEEQAEQLDIPQGTGEDLAEIAEPPIQPWQGWPARAQVPLCFFRVLCPEYQDDFVQIYLGVPNTTVPEAMAEVSSALSTLKLTFAKEVAPTVPQLAFGHASVVLGGTWLEPLGLRILVFDFRAFGGPVYSKQVCVSGHFLDISDEARHQGLTEWQAFLFGSDTPLARGDTFRAIHGGVVQYRASGQQPCWCSSFEHMLTDPVMWCTCPHSPSLPTPATLFLGLGVSRLCLGAIATMEQAHVEARHLLSADVTGLTLVSPEPTGLCDVAVRGCACQTVYAVLDFVWQGRLPTRCVFLDARQVGCSPTFVWLRTDEVSIDYLAKFAGIHRIPPGYHLTVATARPSLTVGYIRIVSGDTIVFGFRTEAESFCDSSVHDTDVPSPPHSDDTTRPSERKDSPPTSSSSDSSPSLPTRHEERSRSPRRHHCLSVGVQCVRSCLRLSFGLMQRLASALHSPWVHFKGRVAGCFKWADPFLFNAAFHEGRVQVTPDTSCACSPCFAPGWNLRGAPAPTLQQRLERPTGSWRLTDTAAAVTGNEEEIDTLDAFLGEPNLEEDFDDGDSGSEDSAFQAIFLLITPDTLPEQVTITFSERDTVPDVLTAVADNMDEARYLLYPHLVPAFPQPDRYWGTLFALPAWLTNESIACFDSRQVDGRFFAIMVPQVATKTQLCQIAGFINPDDVHAFPYGQMIPMGPDSEATFTPGGSVIFARRHFLPRAGLTLEHMLARPYDWDDNPDLPFGPTGHHYCCVREGGHFLVTLDRERRESVKDAASRTLAQDPQQFFVQAASPLVTDAAIRGFHCLDTHAVVMLEAFPGAQPRVATIVDCRPLLQGWSIYLTDSNQVSHSSLIQELDVFTPAGWQVQLDPIDVTDGYFPTFPGRIVVATYVPLTTDEELSPRQPWEGFQLGLSSGSDNPSSHADFSYDPIDEPSPKDHAVSPRSRSRSPHDSTGLQFLGDLWDRLVPPWHIPDCFCFRKLQEPTVCKVLVEPSAQSVSARSRLDALRAHAHSLGIAWPYLRSDDLSFSSRAGPGILLETAVADPVSLHFAVLVPDYVPEIVNIHASIPLGVTAVLRLVQAERDPHMATLFPVLLPALPQSRPGWGLLLALPDWSQ